MLFTEKIGLSVAGDGLGQYLLVGDLHKFVDELGPQHVLDPELGHRGFGAQRDQQVRFASA